MLLRSWDKLPASMQTDAVRPYYDQLYKKRVALFCKAVFDRVVAFVMLLILSPVFLILSIIIKLDSKGPVFFRQNRITAYGRNFKIFKFRTMVVNAESLGAQVTSKNDPRITRVGNLIRKCRLDEIPQLINILLGDMTFVGTRPESAKYISAYTPEMMATLLLPAGVTSIASIMYKDEDTLLEDAEDPDKVYVETILPEKMKYNLSSLKEFGFFKDIGIMFKTVIAVVR